jgi:hypothetical protein
MEGEDYVLSSYYWPALKEVEDTLSPHDGDTGPIAQLRSVMKDDHDAGRITLAQSCENQRDIMMTLLDPR